MKAALQRPVALCVLVALLCYSVHRSLINSAIFEYNLHKTRPWFNFRATKYLSDNGWYAFFHWFDRKSWYPIGRPVGTTIYPGMQITAVGIHRFLALLKIDMNLQVVCYFLPAFSGVVSLIFSFLLAAEVVQEYISSTIMVGTLVVMPAYYCAHMGGEFDNECVALPAMVMTFYFWVRSLRTPKSWPIGVIAGLSYGYMTASWGGHIFVVNMIALHAGVSAFIDFVHYTYNPSLMKAYGLFFAFGTGIAVLVPPVGMSPFYSLEQLSGVAVLVLLLILSFAEKCRVVRKESFSHWASVMRSGLSFAVALCFYLFAAFLSSQGVFFTPLSLSALALFPGMESEPSTFFHRAALHQSRYVSDEVMLVMFQFAYFTTVAGCLYTVVWSYLNPLPQRTFACIGAFISIIFSAKCINLELFTLFMALTTTIVVERSAFFVIHEMKLFVAQGLETNKEEMTEKKTKAAKVVKRKESSKSKENSSGESSWKNVLRKLSEDDVPFVLEKLRSINPSFMLMLSGLPLLFLCILITGTGTFVTLNHYAFMFSNPGVVFQEDLNGTRTITNDYRDSYDWLRLHTASDARVLSTMRPAPHISSIADRISFADEMLSDASYAAKLAKIWISPVKEAHQWLTHLTDYILLWTGEQDNDAFMVPFFALIAQDFYFDVCPDDSNCQSFFPSNPEKKESEDTKQSLLYQLTFHDKPNGTQVSNDYFEEVYTSKRKMVRIFKVVRANETSKHRIEEWSLQLCDVNRWIDCQSLFPLQQELASLEDQIEQ